MRRVNEEHMSISRLCGIQRGFQRVVVKSGLIGGVLREVFFGGTGLA